jgi:exopolysaccharide biosynthesis polyprenyl glycosylphosphotransferase
MTRFRFMGSGDVPSLDPQGKGRESHMSLSDRKLDLYESTAANAGVPASNFAVPASLPEPGSHFDHLRHPKARSLSDRKLLLVQTSCDFVCACIALPLSLLILSALSTVPVNSLHHLWRNTAVDGIFPFAAVIALGLGGVYRETHRRLQPSAFLEMRELCFGVGSGVVLTLALSAALHVLFGVVEAYPTQLVFAVIVTVVVMTIGRGLVRSFLRAFTTTRVLVVGSGSLVDRIMLSVRQDPTMTLVGRAVEGEFAESGTVGRVSDLPTLCKQLDVHRILVASGDQFSNESLNVYRQLQDTVHIAMVPRYYELVSWRSRLTDLAGLPFLEVARPHLSVWDQTTKRAFDLVISSFVLFVTAPILLAVAIGVKFSSPGPVFFRQTRLGRNQVPFTVTKFRSMTVGSECLSRVDEDVQADDEDRPLHEIRKKLDETARITRFGAFLRKTGIDEIPQFINVFKGDMSVVGPRPFIPSESRVKGWATRRFEVRPGITGLWQVSGRNDLSRTDLVQLDYLYVASWSLWWDLKIMWETPRTMARGTGAY